MSPVFGVVTAFRRDWAALQWAYGRCRQSLWTTTPIYDPHNSSSSGSAAKEIPTPPPGPASVRLPLSMPSYTVWGANTNVGKTLVSVGLSYAASKLGVPLSYVKPVQTGFPGDSDARLVALACGGEVQLGEHAAEAVALAARAAGHGGGGDTSLGVGAPARASPLGSCGSGGRALPPPRCSTLFAWQHAVSPHLAVQLEGRHVSDAALVHSVAGALRHEVGLLLQQQQQVTAAATASAGRGAAAVNGGPEPTRGLLLVETAGGVTSPAPSGRLACDVLLPLRPLPAILVGDPRLGGIAATISAFDSLTLRGWEVAAVVMVGQAAAPAVQGSGGGAATGSGVLLDNVSYVRQYLESAAVSLHRMGAPPPLVVGLPACPPPPQGHDPARHGLDPSLAAWLPAALPHLAPLLDHLAARHAARLAVMAADTAAAADSLWWPFTQHASHRTHGGSAPTFIEGRCGETWTTVQLPGTASTAPGDGKHRQQAAGAGESAGGVAGGELVPLYDASCSWWTQAASAELQPEVARAVAAAAGRYLHVLFPEVAHAPALRAAEALLRGPGAPGAGWASRVFFSDDGSTAVEVALKMGFRKYLADRGELREGSPDAGSSSGGGELGVLGLHGAYHGDTLGSQDCVAPSAFNGPLQSPWYTGRGAFLEPPYVGMRQGRWQLLDPPAWLTSRLGPAEQLPSWPSLQRALEDARSSDKSPSSPAARLAGAYVSYIESCIDKYERQPGAGGRRRRIASAILEPLLQGAGGMGLVEPGFQRAMAQVCRSRRIPLIADEVFSGLLRCGAASACGLLGISPDIATYGKLMTAGAAAMAATLATEDVFRAFSGSSKLFALLHGHSYTAYPVGCAATAAAMALLHSPDTNPNLCSPCRCPNTPRCDQPCGRLLPMWDEQAVSELSYHPLVSRVVAIGTVLAVELRTGASSGGSGYASVGAVEVVRRLKDEHGIYARPLGPVVYVMVTPTTARVTCGWLAGAVKAVLDASAKGAKGPVEESAIV